MLKPISVRLNRDECEFVDVYARQHGCRKATAIRELLRIGHQRASHSGFQFAEAVQSIHARLSDLSDSLDEINGSMATIDDRHAAVWVESLMGIRLLLDAQNCGLIDRVKELTTRYMLKAQQR